jgi:lipopolysaccharide heptosyltransferase II
MGALEWADARRILVVRLDSIGDVLMTTPAIRALKRLPGQPHVTLLTSSGGAAAGRLVREVDAVWVYDPPWMKATEAPEAATDLAMIERLRCGEFDAAAIFTVYSQNPLPAALMCHLAGIPSRLAHCRENPYHLLTDWVPDREPAEQVRHEVRRHLDLAAAVGAATEDERLSLRVRQGARYAARGVLAHELGVNIERPWVALHAGASAPSRRYPLAMFGAVARGLSDAGWQVVLTGGEGEHALAAEVAAAAAPGRTFDATGRLDLDGLGALIEAAPLLISNNTGPVHMAAAVGTPVVVLYALTNPQHGPWQVPNRMLFRDVPCRFCYKSVCPEGHQHCLSLVEPSEVVQAALELFEETRAQRGRAA